MNIYTVYILSILYIPTFLPFEIIFCDCMCFLRYSTLAYLFNQKIFSQKLHCYFSSPIHSLKIGSRVKELNVTRTTAEAIHRPWVNVFMGKWQIKSNCLSSDFRQSLICVKGGRSLMMFWLQNEFSWMNELQNAEVLQCAAQVWSSSYCVYINTQAQLC